MTAAAANGPLQGIVVLDLGRVLAAPYCSMILADLGAEVIKIEALGKGDDAREFPPFIQGESGYFMSLNRNKQSLTLNLKHERGREIFRALAAKADVVLENFRPGTMARLGLGYEELKAINPRLIYAAISGFGQTGPYADRPAYDLIIQAMSGIMSLTAHPGGPPTRVGSSISDIVAGMYCAVGILAALQARTQTGQGQMVDVAMLDTQVAILENAIARFSASGKSPAPTGNRHPSITPFQAFPTTDSYIVCAAGNDTLWAKFCQALGLAELSRDPRFASNGLRTENIAALEAELVPVFRQKTTDAWMEIMVAAGIPCAPINTIDRVVADPHVQAREMILALEHPKAGRHLLPGMAIKLSDTPGGVRTPAPTLGQHSAEILARYGLAVDLDELRREGVIG